jgi:hypothetical protein
VAYLDAIGEIDGVRCLIDWKTTTSRYPEGPEGLLSLDPQQIIGEAGTAGASREWIDAECQLAIKHLIKVCGEAPPEMELEVQWQEHDLGEYPMIVLTWEDAMRGAPWEYIERCEEALTEYENR